MSIDNNNTWSCKVTKTCQLEKKKKKKKKLFTMRWLLRCTIENSCDFNVECSIIYNTSVNAVGHMMKSLLLSFSAGGFAQAGLHLVGFQIGG